MSKSTGFNKSTTTTQNTSVLTDSITDSSGNSLSTIISTLVDANTTEDLLIQNCPSISGDNTFSGNNQFNAPIAYDSGVNPTSATHLAHKSYVDNGVSSSISNLLSSNNEFTGTNQFDHPIVYDSSISVGTISGSKMLTTKEYVDGGVSGLLASNNTWTGTQNFNSGSLTLGNGGTAIAIHGNATYDNLPVTGTDLSGSVNNNNQLIPKKYADGLITTLKSSTNTYTGQNIFNNDVVLGNTSGLNNISQYGNSLVHGPAVFDSLPATGTDLSGSVTDDKQLAPKKYVDTKANSILSNNNTFSGNNSFTGSSMVLSLVPTLAANYSQPSGNALSTKTYVDSTVGIVTQSSYHLGLATTQSFISTVWAVKAPNLGTGSTATTTPNLLDTFYLNFSRNNSFGPNSCILEFAYYLHQNVAVSTANGAYTNGSVGGGNQNQITRSSPQFQTSDFSLFPGYSGSTSAAPLTPIFATIQVSMMNLSGLIIKPLMANINVVSSAGASTTTTYANTTIKYNGVSIAFTPIVLTYVSQNKVQVRIYSPKMDNCPGVSGFVSNLGCSLTIRSGDTTPSGTLTNTTSCYFTSS